MFIALLLGTLVNAGLAEELQAFSYTDTETARQHWVPQFGSLPVRVETLDDGTTCLAFDAEFAQPMDRACWDWVQELDLSGAGTVSFEVSADNGGLGGNIGIYFGTENGWYATFWWGGVPDSWTRRTFVLEEFGTEGEPDGWGRITRFRFSIWATGPGKTTYRLRRMEVSPLEPGTNFLRNGSFEISGPSMPYAWGSGHWGIGDLPWAADMDLWRQHWYLDRREAKHGEVSLCIVNAPDLPRLRAVSVWLHPPRRARQLALSAWLKSDQESMPVILDCGGHSVEAKVGREWTQVQLTGIERQDYLTAVIAPQSVGRLWVDAVQLQRDGEVTVGFRPAPEDEAIAAREAQVDWSPPRRTAEVAAGRSISGTPPVESVRIDEHGRFLVNGDPYIPHSLGLEYISDLGMLDLTARLGFRDVTVEISRGVTTERLKAIFDRCAEVGLRIIPWLDGDIPRDRFEEHIRTLKGHPALLCWYVFDEPSGERFAEADARYHLAKQLDPSRPALINYLADKLTGQTGDIYSTDVYPIPHSSPSAAIGAVAQMKGAAEKEGKPVWMWLQGTGYAYWMDREPTPRELSCMAYGSLLSGARGIYYFAQVPRTAECLAEMRALCIELDAISPALYSLEAAPEATSDQPALLLGAYHHQEQIWVVAVNTRGAPCTARLRCAGVRGTVEVLFEGRQVEAGHGSWSDDFGPYERHVYRTALGATALQASQRWQSQARVPRRGERS